MLVHGWGAYQLDHVFLLVAVWVQILLQEVQASHCGGKPSCFLVLRNQAKRRRLFAIGPHPCQACSRAS